MDSNKAAFGLVGLGLAGLVLYLANQSVDEPMTGVPQYQTEAQFSGLDTDDGMRVNQGTPLDLSPDVHFFVDGYCCPDQELVPPRHRYPIVSGGNITAVIDRGFDSMIKGSPDNAWRVTPPSEYTI